MNLFKTTVWKWFDIACLKWSCILSGMIAGAYCADFTKRYVVVMAAAALLLAIRPAMVYFRKSAACRQSREC